jgi:hypothetical protein
VAGVARECAFPAMAEEEEEIEVEPEPELTPAEKIANLKSALKNGDMGPSEFDQEYQKVWMEMKEKEGMVRVSRQDRSSISMRTITVANEEEEGE